MALMEQWREFATEKGNDKRTGKAFWTDYFQQEKGFYEKLLDEKDVITGTVKELAERYGIDVIRFTGVLDGIDESLKKANPLEEMDEDTVVSLDYDKEKLFKNMVESQADWLYNLPQWDQHLTIERRKELNHEQRASHTIVKEKKIFPNDPCPCGSGKKYKHCCGRKK